MKTQFKNNLTKNTKKETTNKNYKKVKQKYRQLITKFHTQKRYFTDEKNRDNKIKNMPFLQIQL